MVSLPIGSGHRALTMISYIVSVAVQFEKQCRGEREKGPRQACVLREAQVACCTNMEGLNVQHTKC